MVPGIEQSANGLDAGAGVALWAVTRHGKGRSQGTHRGKLRNNGTVVVSLSLPRVTSQRWRFRPGLYRLTRGGTSGNCQK